MTRCRKEQEQLRPTYRDGQGQMLVSLLRRLSVGTFPPTLGTDSPGVTTGIPPGTPSEFM